MPIDVERALGFEFPVHRADWDADDVILYHLGIGAGNGKATDPRELEYTYEKNLKVLPSFAVIPVQQTVANLLSVPGIDADLSQLLHGEQSLELHQPIPIAARVESRARIVEIWDRRSAASIVTEAETRDENGQLLFTNRFSLFLRGEGGFGGKPGPRRVNRAPRREPDLVVHTPTATHLSLLYRLSGDKNPLHADPEFARRAGFEAPILHGLCSYGVVCKAAVDAALDGEVAAVAAYAARFSGAAFPGETIVTSIWREDGRLLISAKTQERSSPVLSDAALDLR